MPWIAVSNAEVISPICVENYGKIHGVGTKGLPKSTKMMPRSAPKATLEASRPQVEFSRYFLDAFRIHLGDFGRHFGTQLGAKGLPKSSFLAPSRPKIAKNDRQNEVSEKT